MLSRRVYSKTRRRFSGLHCTPSVLQAMLAMIGRRALLHQRRSAIIEPDHPR
jgi:hypothetical protein